jgi:uncharacterized integral membrane protein
MMKVKLIGAWIAGVLTFLLAAAGGALIAMQSAAEWKISVINWKWEVNGAVALMAAALFGVAMPFLLKAMFRCGGFIMKSKSAAKKLDKAVAKAAAPVPTPTPTPTPTETENS